MIPEERREKIVTLLKQKGIYSVESLARELEVSRITIQRDINLMEKAGRVQKIHGGVKLRDDEKGLLETRFRVRLKQNYEKKLEIAGKALLFVSDHTTIFLDSSTTVYIFACELFKKKFVDLNIITNSPSILCESLKFPDLRVISTGGEVRSDFNMLGGDWVIDFLEKVNIDSAFISVGGVSEDNVITTSNRELANILSKVFERSEEVNLLVDSTKFSKVGMLNIAPISRCKRVIVDSGIKDETKKDVIVRLKNIEGSELVF